ncbi:MAG: substrate-binding domain-containing protein [Rectinemataceae bacterium]|nr:substrate-binding domain-containing protein [Rectinemataceae bacterium]
MRKFFLVLGGVMVAFSVFSQGITLYAAAGVKAPMTDIVTHFKSITGIDIALVFDTAGGAETRFLADPSATFLVTSKVRVDQAMKAGKLFDGITFVLGDTVAGIAAAPGTIKPDISTSEKFKAALLAAPSIAFSDPAKGATVGTHFLKVIEKLGIKDEVLAKATLGADGTITMDLVLSGKVSLGVTQLSEVIQANPESIVGPFPPEFDLATTYTLWYRSAASEKAKAFAAYLALPESRARLTADGVRAPVL